MERIIVQLEGSTIEELDGVAEETGLSRSALIRTTIIQALAERRRRRELQQIIDSYRKDPMEKDLIAPPEALARVWPE